MSKAQSRAEGEKAKAEAMKLFLGQMFSSPKIVTEGAEESGDIDAWMMSNIPAEMLLSLQGLNAVAIQDDLPWLKEFIRTTLSGLKGIEGYANNIGRDIAVAGFGGGKGKTMVKKRSFLSRHITDRGAPDYEEVGEPEGE
jgi:hypothetical protein